MSGLLKVRLFVEIFPFDSGKVVVTRVVNMPYVTKGMILHGVGYSEEGLHPTEHTVEWLDWRADDPEVIEAWLEFEDFREDADDPYSEDDKQHFTRQALLTGCYRDWSVVGDTQVGENNHE